MFAYGKILLLFSSAILILLSVGCKQAPASSPASDWVSPEPAVSAPPPINSTIYATIPPLPPIPFNGDIEISQAYCNYGNTQSFPFRFTLKNITGADLDLEYKWSLHDPMSDYLVYKGQGGLSLSALSDREIEINVPKKYYTDPRIYVMRVNVYNGETELALHNQQKTISNWDYSVLPPVKREPKPINKTFLIDTLVKKASEGYKIIINDIIYLPPEEIPLLDLKQIAMYPGINNVYRFLLADLISPHPEAPYGLRFYDVDANGLFSKGDYLTVNEQAEGVNFEIENREEPSIHIRGISPLDESIIEENPEAIRLNSVNYRLNDDQTLDIEAEVTHSNPLQGNLVMIQPNPKYNEKGICSLETIAVTQGNTSLYRYTFDYGAFKQSTTFSGFNGPWYLYIRLYDFVDGIGRVNEALYFVCELP